MKLSIWGTSTLLAFAIIPTISFDAKAGTFNPHRNNTQAEDRIVIAETAARKGDFNTAIINFRRAKDAATTECENGFAESGEQAAVKAKSAAPGMGPKHPHVGQAVGIYMETYHQLAEEVLPDECFV